MTQNRYDSIYRPGLFDGRVVLVTGGGSGIGRCTAHELAALGATVVIAGRREELLEQTVAEIHEAGGKAGFRTLDIRDEEAGDAAVRSVVEEHGALHGLFNNAGGQFPAPVSEISAKGWRTVIDLNLNGTFLMCCAAYRHAMKENGGSIVNMLADIWTGYPGMAHMSAARAGIENLSWTLSMEWSRNDIRVNCVAPGTILSSGMHHYPREIQELTADGCKDSPPVRLGTESEVSAAVVFLMSPGAAYMSGTTLMIDGGARFQKNRLFEVARHKGLSAYDGFHLKPDFSGTPFARDEDGG
jgi:citronellol/citronellal dehydrogenase